VKILIVGDWRWPQYEQAFACSLRDNDVEVIKLSTSIFFKGALGRIELTLPLPGPALVSLNRAVLVEAQKHQPDWVLFWRPTHVLPSTIHKLGVLGLRSVSYNNDDPFGPKAHGNVPWHHHFLWHWYIKCLPRFDCNFFYRKINCAEAKACGANHAEVLLPYFIPWQDRPVQLTAVEQQRYETDVVFVGHYEPDGREDSIRALVTAGIHFKLWGGHYWSRSALGNLYDSLSPIMPAESDEYGKALCGAKICLCFLSKLNRDTYTRRCFEIPACGKVLLAERTDDLMRFFKEDEEACFFSSSEELVHKAQWLINNPDIRERIAQAGLRRVWADGHDVGSRVRSFLVALDKR
jgi:glycosyltransferase involved in cell wall biosynthesis